MEFIDKYTIFSRGFYLLILGLTIPYYLLLYGASGHEFNPTSEDMNRMTTVIVAFVTMIIYLATKQKTGLIFKFIRVMVMITLILTTFGGVKALLSNFQFNYGNDISFMIIVLSYLIPLLFIFTCIINLLGLFIKTK
jgi:hypothetical protein